MKSAFFFLLLLTSCATQPHIGGREFALAIHGFEGEKEVHATAFLIQQEKWLARKLDIEAPECRRLIEEDRVTEGKTPVTTYAPSYQYIVVVEYNGRLFRTRDAIVPGMIPSVTVAVQ